MKICSKCGIPKTEDCFYHRGHGIGRYGQYDNLPSSKKQILQAVITVPLTKKQSAVLQNFKLWTD